MHKQATGAPSAKKTTPRLERTTTKGIYKRGNTFVVVYYDNEGRQRKRHARTFTEAKRLKAALSTDVHRGEHVGSSRLTLAQYEEKWAESYHGRSGRGVRKATVQGYREDLRLHVFRPFPFQ